MHHWGMPPLPKGLVVGQEMGGALNSPSLGAAGPHLLPHLVRLVGEEAVALQKEGRLRDDFIHEDSGVALKMGQKGEAGGGGGAMRTTLPRSQCRKQAWGLWCLLWPAGEQKAMRLPMATGNTPRSAPSPTRMQSLGFEGGSGAGWPAPHLACQEGHARVRIVEGDEGGGGDVEAEAGHGALGQEIRLVQGELALAVAEGGGRKSS